MEGSVVETYGGGKLDAERAVGCGCEEACEHNGSIQRQIHLCGSAGGGEGFIFLAVHLQQQVETAGCGTVKIIGQFVVQVFRGEGEQDCTGRRVDRTGSPTLRSRWELSVSTRLLVGQTGGHSHDLCQSDGFVWGKGV